MSLLGKRNICVLFYVYPFLRVIDDFDIFFVFFFFFYVLTECKTLGIIMTEKMKERERWRRKKTYRNRWIIMKK